MPNRIGVEILRANERLSSTDNVIASYIIIAVSGCQHGKPAGGGRRDVLELLHETERLVCGYRQPYWSSSVTVDIKTERTQTLSTVPCSSQYLHN